MYGHCCGFVNADHRGGVIRARGLGGQAAPLFGLAMVPRGLAMAIHMGPPRSKLTTSAQENMKKNLRGLAMVVVLVKI